MFKFLKKVFKKYNDVNCLMKKDMEECAYKNKEINHTVIPTVFTEDCKCMKRIKEIS
jgi:hypothetical protein